MSRVLVVLALVLAGVAPAAAQPEVDALRLILGAAGSTCTARTGSGAPSSGLGAVCDVYVRTDSPYTVYVKTGGSTWSAVVRLPGDTGLTTVGALDTGSIAAGFGAIDVGTDPITGGVGTLSTRVVTPQVTTTGGANLTLDPQGDLILGPTGADILPDVGYSRNLGSLTRKLLTLHAAELWVETLVAAETMATIGGRVLVGPTTTLTADLAAAATSIQVKHNQIASGDRLVLQANGAIEWLAVTSSASGSAGAYVYSVTRDLDGSGANDWTAGDAVFNSGTTGDGFIDLYSVNGVVPGSTAGPAIVGNVRTGTTYSQIEPRWAIGNLHGVSDYATDTYGALFGNPSATHVTVDATNGVRIRNGTTSKFTADTSGNLSIVGDLAVGTAGVIRSGATAYGSGTGYWLAYNGGTPQLRVGTTSGNRLAWDGTDLTLVSANLSIGASGALMTPSTSFGASRAYGFTAATGSNAWGGFETGGASLGGRGLYALSEWTGTGNLTNGVSVWLNASHAPTSGGTTAGMSLRLQATSSVQAAIFATASGSGYLALTDPMYLATNRVVPYSGSSVYFTYPILFDTSQTIGAGGVGKSAVNGLMVRGITGSTYDLYLANNAGSGVMAVPAGTTELQIAGVSTDGSGSVLCVKADATIGTCTGGVDGSGNCTCS